MRSAVFAAVVALAACKTSKEQWISNWEPAMVDWACQPDYLFRRCFDVDATGCRQTARDVVHACVLEHDRDIPDELDSTIGRDVGTKIGRCVGGRLFDRLSHEHKRTSDPKCDDPDAWR